MIQLTDAKVAIENGRIREARAEENGRAQTLAARIWAGHDKSRDPGRLEIAFDCLASHDITYVSIIQSARAAGLKEFPVPYVLTNCHNSLCAVGGTINEDDHVFGLQAAKKYGGIFVPAHLAVLHQYIREMMAGCGRMILGSDSHTRYGALGALGVGEGGPELVRQLIGETWNIPTPEVIAIWLEGRPAPGVGPQDVALALIGAVYKNNFVKNRVMEFHGPGIANLSMDFRNGIDVMTTEAGCMTSIWQTDEVVRDWLEKHGRGKDYRELKLEGTATYDGLVRINLDTIEPMIALPFHPGNVHTIREFNQHAAELLAEVDAEAVKQFGKAGAGLNLKARATADGVIASQGIIAGCAGGTFENISYASAILGDWTRQNPDFSLALYPASVPVATALIGTGATERLMTLGAIVKTAFCGPCFGAGDIPANGALSLRHTTRNFPNREGSKPGEGQIAAVALMDARSIAASAANGGRITAATDLDWQAGFPKPDLSYHFNPRVYEQRVYNGYKKPNPEAQLVYGPNITDIPKMEPLPEHLVLEIASVILDPVTTTDELIPSGETSSLRSNPQKLAEHTLERKDPGYVARAKAMLAKEQKRLANPADPELLAWVKGIIDQCSTQPVAEQMLDIAEPLTQIGLGSAIFAMKPGDGSAREQAASSQRILGGWANLAAEYATKRYRSNLINWGMLPFVVTAEIGHDLKVGDYLVIPHIRSYVFNGHPEAFCALLHATAAKPWSEQIVLGMKNLTREEREIIMAGSLSNYQAEKGADKES